MSTAKKTHCSEDNLAVLIYSENNFTSEDNFTTVRFNNLITNMGTWPEVFRLAQLKMHINYTAAGIGGLQKEEYCSQLNFIWTIIRDSVY